MEHWSEDFRDFGATKELSVVAHYDCSLDLCSLQLDYLIGTPYSDIPEGCVLVGHSIA